MSETPWTKGPWTATRRSRQIDGAFDFAIDAPGMPIIAEAFGRTSNGRWPNAYANARLIAAAPELAEALETLLDAAITFDNIISAENEAVYQSAIEYARAALSKAKGETT